MLLLSCFSRVQHCATLWTVTCQAPLFVGFSRQEYWSGLPGPPPEDPPNPGIEPRSPPPHVDSLPAEPHEGSSAKYITYLEEHKIGCL